MKKLLALLLAVLTVVTMAACTAEKVPESTEGETDPPVDVQTGATPKIPEPESLENFFDDAAFIGDSVTLKLPPSCAPATMVCIMRWTMCCM